MSTTEVITWRLAEERDLMLYFNWVNDADVRRNSFDSTPVSLEKHTAWFLNSIDAENILMLLFFQNETPIGQVRYICEGDIARLNYSIALPFRGKGFAALLIRQSIDAIQTLRPGIRRIHAEVKADNPASVKAFEKCHFRISEEPGDRFVFVKQLGTLEG